MENNSDLKIISHIESSEGCEDFVAEHHSCIRQKENVIFVFYKEDTIESDNPTNCRFQLEDDKLILKKTGSINTTMIYDPNSITTCQYSTPLGSYELTVKTLSFLTEKNENEITINLSYILESNNISLGTYKLTIKINIY